MTVNTFNGSIHFICSCGKIISSEDPIKAEAMYKAHKAVCYLVDLEARADELSEDTSENRTNKTLLQMEIKNIKFDLRNIERPQQ